MNSSLISSAFDDSSKAIFVLDKLNDIYISNTFVKKCVSNE